MNINEKNVKSTSRLFIFYKKLNKKNNDRIIIYAESYIEAKDMLFSINNYADLIYDIIEYQLQHVLTEKLFEICKVDTNYFGIPFVVSESEYNILIPYIDDKQQSQLQHTKVLTKKYLDILSPEAKTNMYSTGEFINLLQENTDIHIKRKKEIKNMLNTVGDIWFIRIGEVYKKCRYVYGKSRYQCKRLVNDLEIKEYYTIPELLITYNGNNYDNISIKDLDNYDKMISYMKKNNIKKFPFITSND